MMINGNGNGVCVPSTQTNKLRLNPATDHQPDSYEDLLLDFSPALFSSLERYLPHAMLNADRQVKIEYMMEILKRYCPDGERIKAKRQRDYRQKILSNYQPLHRELYTINASSFFVPSFLKAINENSVGSFRSIISEPSPGIYTFDMFQPQFCKLLLKELENFERWVHDTKFQIVRPNTMNRYGAVLDDFGFENMLDNMMDSYIRPLSKAFYPEVGGASLDSHHGFLVEYALDRDVDLGFHVDDSEVTLNVCLSTQFCGGELFFRGVRCEQHVNTDTREEEIYDYSHVPGQAILHRGRHRHGARATTSGRRINLILWCRSSSFREFKRHQHEFSRWCGECHRHKQERHHRAVAAAKMVKHIHHLHTSKNLMRFEFECSAPPAEPAAQLSDTLKVPFHSGRR